MQLTLFITLFTLNFGQAHFFKLKIEFFIFFIGARMSDKQIIELNAGQIFTKLIEIRANDLKQYNDYRSVKDIFWNFHDISELQNLSITMAEELHNKIVERPE